MGCRQELPSYGLVPFVMGLALCGYLGCSSTAKRAGTSDSGAAGATVVTTGLGGTQGTGGAGSGGTVGSDGSPDSDRTRNGPDATADAMLSAPGDAILSAPVDAILSAPGDALVDGPPIDIKALCRQNCDNTSPLACGEDTSRCAAVCYQWYSDAGACKTWFVDYLRCVAPRPAAEFHCGCCGWVLTNGYSCAAERKQFEACLQEPLD